MCTQATKINADSLDEFLQDNSVNVFAIVGKTMCGKTHLADALVKSLRDVRSPCFPIFIDEVHPDVGVVITGAIQVAALGRPVVVACQAYRDVSQYIAECVTLGSAIVISGHLGDLKDVEALSAHFGIDASALAATPNREFLVLRRTTN